MIIRITTTTPFPEILRLYAEEKMLALASQKGYRAVFRALTAFVKPNDELLLEHINRQLFIEWRTYLLEVKKVSPETWNNYRRHIFAVLRWCEILGWDAGVTMQSVKQSPLVDRKKKTLDVLGLHEIFRRVEDDKKPIRGVNPGWFWVATMKILYFTGVRRRQLVGLTWGDVDEKRMTILLRAAHSKTKREWSIPLAPALLPVLSELREKTQKALLQNKNRRIRRDDQLLNVCLFHLNNHSPQMTEEHVSNAFRRIRETTGYEISAHRFRHTIATKLAKEGDLKELQHLLGHTNLSTTMGYIEADVTRMRSMLGGLSL